MRASSLSRSSSSRLFLPLLGLLVAACDPIIVGGGGGAGGSAPSTTSGGSVSCANPTPVGLPPAAICTPTNVTCGAASSVCLATAHAAAAPTFDMRVAQLTLSAPEALRHGIVQSVFQGAVLLNRPLCNLGGSGAFNWLLHVDTSAGTLEVGAARGVADPNMGYSFIHEAMTLGTSTFPVAPVTTAATLDASCGLESAPIDVFLPFFGGVGDSAFTIFPLRSLRFFDTVVTPDHDCIGAYNAAGLDPANNCIGDEQHRTFLDGGHFEAFISLEEADTVLVPVLGQTLCVLLSDSAPSFGDGGQPSKCKRDSTGNIVLQGDWCSVTNQPASGGCADAMRFAGSFAASGVAIH